MTTTPNIVIMGVAIPTSKRYTHMYAAGGGGTLFFLAVSACVCRALCGREQGEPEHLLLPHDEPSGLRVEETTSKIPTIEDSASAAELGKAELGTPDERGEVTDHASASDEDARATAARLPDRPATPAPRGGAEREGGTLEGKQGEAATLAGESGETVELEPRGLP